MLKKIFKMFLIAIAVLPVVGIIFFGYANLPSEKRNMDARFGVTFSSRYAQDIGLDWKEAYLAALDDLGVKRLRVPAYWDLIEKEEGKYDFADLDWQIAEASVRDAGVILAVGQKVPRWPECHIPEWAQSDKNKKDEALLKFIGKTVERYRENPTIKFWQVENEPFLPFGICPPLDVDLLDKELELVRRLDGRKIIVTDSGELSLWFRAAKRADVFGTTMYLTIWKDSLGGKFTYPIGPRFFHFKQKINEIFAKQKNTIIIELQAEPWIGGWTTHAPLDKQLENFDAERLEYNIDFARKTGFSEIYLWGVEWWYWLKKHQDHPQLWEAARKYF
ncbi:MAG TPA: hypothetical protein DIT25_00535 [Candidatus Moranbacteria bacterium]|nr:hypothetical protein [Candidatus Moranbacteria bacterium]